MTYKEKYLALQAAIKFEIECVEKHVSELNEKFEALDPEGPVNIFQAADKGIQTGLEMELKAMRRWVSK